MAKVNTNVPAQWHDLVTAVRTSTEGALYDLGQYREEDGKGYRYVKQNDATVTVTANSLAYLAASDTTGYTVCQDVSDSDVNLVSGVYQSVIADGGFGWIQTRGPCTVNTNGDDNIAAADAIIGVGDGTCDSVAQDTAPTNKVVGWAMAADSDSANTVLVFLTLD